MTRIDTTSEGSGRRGNLLPLRLFLATALAGCALFEPRDSQQPDDGDHLAWRPPISPDAVLANLATVVAALEPVVYGELLADSGWTRPFRFVADPAVAGQGLSWGLEEELAAWQRFCDHYEALQARPSLHLLRTDSLTAGDSASYTADYRLALPASAGRSDEAWAGTLRLGLSRNLLNGDWAIHRWEDWGADSLPSWTQLKQVFLWP